MLPSVFLRPNFHPCHQELPHLLRSARPGEEAGRSGKVSKCYIPRDHFIRHVVILDDTDESLVEKTQKVTFIL